MVNQMNSTFHTAPAVRCTYELHHGIHKERCHIASIPNSADQVMAKKNELINSSLILPRETFIDQNLNIFPYLSFPALVTPTSWCRMTLPDPRSPSPHHLMSLRWSGRCWPCSIVTFVILLGRKQKDALLISSALASDLTTEGKDWRRQISCATTS